MHQNDSSPARADRLHLAMVVSQYHRQITDRLRDGAVAHFLEAGGSRDDLLLVGAAGAWEITAICRALANETARDGIVALGCIITGETTHDRHISESLVWGLTQITLQTGMPIAFGILTCQSMEQARARSGGSRGNKGVEAMNAAIQTACTLRDLRGQREHS